MTRARVKPKAARKNATLRLELDPMERHVEELLRENAQLRARLTIAGQEAPVRFCDRNGSSTEGMRPGFCLLEAGHSGEHLYSGPAGVVTGMRRYTQYMMRRYAEGLKPQRIGRERR